MLYKMEPTKRVTKVECEIEAGASTSVDFLRIRAIGFPLRKEYDDYELDIEAARKSHGAECEFFSTEDFYEDLKSADVHFWNCPVVEFVPPGIFTHITKNINIGFHFCYIPRVTFELFNQKLARLQQLDLSNNQISTIHENAFYALHDLEWIDLHRNNLREINHKIFEQNRKLNYIDLSSNKIRSLHPELFEVLHQLEDVKIEKNPMIDTNFSVDAGEGWYEAMVEELSPLFENFRHENSTAELMDKELKALKEQQDQSRQEIQDLKRELEKKQEYLASLQKEASQNNVNQCYKKLLANCQNSRETDGDLTLEFPDNKTLKAHKSILKAHSSKFAEILSKNSRKIIKISNFKFEIMKQVLDFIYSGELGFSAEDAADLLDVSQKFKIPVLKEFLLEHVDEILNVDNFLAFYDAAKEEGLDDTKEKALIFFKENLQEIRKTEKWLEICSDRELLVEFLLEDI